jgi:hypothetical protein
VVGAEVLKARKPSSSGPLCDKSFKAVLKSGKEEGELLGKTNPARPHMEKC